MPSQWLQEQKSEQPHQQPPQIHNSGQNESGTNHHPYTIHCEAQTTGGAHQSGSSSRTRPLSDQQGIDSKRTFANRPRKLKVAVVGSGLAGLTAAHLLSSLHTDNGHGDEGIEVHLFEKAPKLGLESTSLSVACPCLECVRADGRDNGDPNHEHIDGRMDVPMRSFFPEYYPNLIRLYRSIGVKIHDADNTLACFDVDFPSTSASVPSGLPSRDRTQRQTTAQVQEPYLSSRSYKVTSGHTITLPDLPPFSVLNPYPFGRRVLAYCRIAKDYVRMLMVSKEFMSKGRMMDIGKHPIEWGNGRRITLREFLEAGSYSHDFVTFFVPLFACVCTCSFERVMEYPACVVLEYVARCMPFGRMQFVSSGIHEVAEKLSRNVETIHYNTIVEHVFEADKTRHLTCQSEDDDEGVRPVVLVDSNGVQRSFDHVIFATQANQAAALLAGHKPKNEYRSSSPYGTSKENDSSSEDANYEYRDKRERAGPEIIPMDLGSGVLKTSQPFYHQIKTLLKIPYERTQVVCHTDPSFLPKNPAHWRLLNIAKSTNADVLASPLRRLAQELEPEMAMRSRKAQAPRPSIFSVKPSSSLRSRSVHRKTSQNRLKTQFAPPADLLKTSSSSSSSMPITTTASHSHNSAMATHIMNRTCKGLGETTQFLQTTNPIYQPRSEKILSSTWFERAVVNPESIKAVDELQTQMEQQTARWIDRNGSLTSVEEDERTPAQISDRVWFVGSYAYAGIPLLEGCVVSAVQVMERIIASEPSLKLAASFNAPMESFLKQDEPMRERRRRRREALVGSEKQEQQHQQQGNGRSNHRSKPTPSSIYFQTAWKDALADDRKWEERQSSGVVGMSWLSNVYVEMAWMLVLYLLAIVEWWMVMAIESFGGNASRWALA